MVTGNDEENPRDSKPNWVDKWTLYVLSLTLMGVWFYACEAHKQNKHLADSVAQQILDSRPVLLPKTPLR